MNYGAIDTQTHCRVLLRDMSAPGLRFSLAACSALYRGELLLGGGARATKPSAPAPTTTSRTVSSTCSKRDGAGVPLDARTWVEIHHRSDPDLTQAYVFQKWRFIIHAPIFAVLNPEEFPHTTDMHTATRLPTCTM